MIDMKIFKRALVVGIALEIALVAMGWFRPSFRPALLFACMLTAAVAGMLYARDGGRGFLSGMLGGAMVGDFHHVDRPDAPGGQQRVLRVLPQIAEKQRADARAIELDRHASVVARLHTLGTALRPENVPA